MVKLKLINIKECFQDSIKLIFLDETNTLKFAAGQFLTFLLDKQKKIFKSLSIASSPRELPYIEVAFRLTNDDFSRFVINNLVENDIVYALPPEGEFVLDTKMVNSQNIVFITIGSGITPIFSILKSELDLSKDLNFFLFWGNKNVSTAYYWNEIIGLEKRFSNKFKIVKFLSQSENISNSQKGRMSVDSIMREINAYNISIKKADYFISGSGEFVKDINNFLIAQNVLLSNIHLEKYDYSKIKSQINHSLNNFI